MTEPASALATPAPAAPRWFLDFGAFCFRRRDLLFPVVFLGLVLVSAPGTLFGSRTWDRVLDALGTAVAIAGQVLRATVIGLAYIRRGGLHGRVHADALVVDGLFAHSRNPLYLGNFLALCGFCLIHHSTACYLVGIPFFALAYLAIVATEESFLSARFGATFEDYRRRVPRFLPEPRGLRRTLSSMRFDWRRLLRKEYGSTFAGLTTILVLLVWDDFRRFGFQRAELTAAALIWAPLVAAYLLARWLKKTGRLGEGVTESIGDTGER